MDSGAYTPAAVVPETLRRLLLARRAPRPQISVGSAGLARRSAATTASGATSRCLPVERCGDAIERGSLAVAGQVGITLRAVNIVMAEQLAEDKERDTATSCRRGE